MTDRDQIHEKLKETLEKPGGKQALRYALATLGSVPFVGGAIAGGGAAWAEHEQNAVNQLFFEWASVTDSYLDSLSAVLDALLAEPSTASLAILLGEIAGEDVANQLLDENNASIPIVLNQSTIAELEPYLAKGWVSLQPTGAVCSMGAGNRVGNHLEELKRPYGLGNGFVLTVQPNH